MSTEEIIEFTTIRDDFSEYELENGQILKAKTSVVNVVNVKDKDGKEKGGVGLQPFTHVITPSNLERYGIEYTKGVATEKDQVKELNFKTKREVMNIYETKKSVILVGFKMEKIFLTNKVNDRNEPILRFQSKNALNVIDKPDYTGKPDAILSDQPNSTG